MEYWLQLKVEGFGYQEIIPNMNVIRRSLPMDLKKRLNEIFTQYLAKYGVEGACERVKDRTLQQIFAEYRPDDVGPIASGEKDGIRWKLYGAPEADESATQGE